MSEATQAKAEPAPKIEVRNLQHSEFWSKETHCFEATVYVDGVAFCRARNDGHGGADFYEPLKAKKGSHKELYEAIEAIGARLPADPDYNFDPATLFEIAVGEAVNVKLTEGVVKRHLRTRVLFHDPERGGIYHVRIRGRKKPTKADFTAMREKVLRDTPNAVILNDLPLDEAVRLFRES